MNSLDTGIAKARELGCPEEILNVIRSFVEMLSYELGKKGVGVLLVGSASRGELSWEILNDEFHVFSDIEFLVAVEDKSSINKNAIFDNVKSIEKEVNLGVFFHIDYTFIEWESLKYLDTKFFVFESKKCGIDFFDEKIVSRLPDVNKDNLYWKELNEVLVHRLTSMLHAIPGPEILKEMCMVEQQKLSLNIAKNTLDVTTWLHPYESNELKAGHGNRLSSWQVDEFSQLKLSEYFTENDLLYMRQCLELRKKPSTSSNPLNMLHKTMHIYKKSIMYMMNMNKLDDETELEEFRVCVKLFDEYRFRQRVSQAISITKNIQRLGYRNYIRNLFGNRRCIATNICMELLYSLLDECNSGNGLDRVSRARDILSRVTLVATNESKSFEQAWTDVRDCFKQYQSISRNY